MKSRVVLDRYLVESLMPDLVGHDKQPAAFIVYLQLYSRALGARGGKVAASYTSIAADTGLSRSGVQAAVKWLRRRRLVDQQRAHPTATPVYTVHKPWRARVRR